MDCPRMFFRHTWATNAVIDGKPIEQVAAFLGDTVDTVRNNYIHLVLSEEL